MTRHMESMVSMGYRAAFWGIGWAVALPVGGLFAADGPGGGVPLSLSLPIGLAAFAAPAFVNARIAGRPRPWLEALSWLVAFVVASQVFSEALFGEGLAEPGEVNENWREPGTSGIRVSLASGEAIVAVGAFLAFGFAAGLGAGASSGHQRDGAPAKWLRGLVLFGLSTAASVYAGAALFAVAGSILITLAPFAAAELMAAMVSLFLSGGFAGLIVELARFKLLE